MPSPQRIASRTALASASFLALAICALGYVSCGENQSREREDESREDFSGPCGTWRWSVKTGGDGSAQSVRTTPQPASIGDLGAKPVPGALQISTPRYLPPTTDVETTVFRVSNAVLVKYKGEADSDIHLALQDPRDPTRTMIAEIPDAAACVGLGTPFHDAIARVRQTFAAKYTASGSYQSPPQTEYVTLTGIGFFDELHGATDSAPNGLELHPVLSLCFGLDCAAPAGGSTWAVRAAVSGLASGSLLLRNGADVIDVTGNGTVTFPTRLTSGAAYSVRIEQVPAGQQCASSGASGTIGAQDVLVQITCSSVPDAGVPDAGVVDGGATDAGSGDAGPGDAGSADAGTTDAGSADAGSTDAGASDAGSHDAGAPDAGRGDAGTAGGGQGDGGATGTDDGGIHCPDGQHLSHGVCLPGPPPAVTSGCASGGAGTWATLLPALLLLARRRRPASVATCA